MLIDLVAVLRLGGVKEGDQVHTFQIDGEKIDVSYCVCSHYDDTHQSLHWVPELRT